MGVQAVLLDNSFLVPVDIEADITCPVCEASLAGAKLSRFSRFRVCPACGSHVLAGSVPLIGNYGEAYFASPTAHTGASRLFAPLLQTFIRMRVRRIERVLPKSNAKILDYGCGRGDLIRALKARGYAVWGYEPSQAAVALAAKEGLPVSAAFPAASSAFDLIMFWHSLEHVPDPLATLRRARALLSPEGRFLIAVPNAAGWESYIAGDWWFHYDYPFHLVHFTPRALASLFDRIGFRAIHWDFVNIDYTFSGFIQTFLNLIFPKNVIYHALTHRRAANGSALLLLSLGTLVVFSPVIILVYLLALLSRRTGAVIVAAEHA